MSETGPKKDSALPPQKFNMIIEDNSETTENEKKAPSLKELKMLGGIKNGDLSMHMHFQNGGLKDLTSDTSIKLPTVRPQNPQWSSEQLEKEHRLLKYVLNRAVLKSRFDTKEKTEKVHLVYLPVHNSKEDLIVRMQAITRWKGNEECQVILSMHQGNGRKNKEGKSAVKMVGIQNTFSEREVLAWCSELNYISFIPLYKGIFSFNSLYEVLTTLFFKSFSVCLENGELKVKKQRNQSGLMRIDFSCKGIDYEARY